MINVGPESLGDCLAAAATGNATRCVLAPGVYRDSIEFNGPGSLSIEGSGAGVVMDGTTPIDGVTWSVHNGSIFKALLPPALQIKNVQQAFIDGSWISEARFPNTNLDKILRVKGATWADCGKGSAKGKCVDRPDTWSDLAKTGVDWTGALLTINTGRRYAAWTRRVRGHSAGSGTFHYDPDLGPGPGDAGSWVNGKYFLTGKLEGLDAPGEWFIDENTWTAYVWAPDSKTPEGRFRVKVKDYCVDLSGSGSSVANMDFFGCTFRVQKCSSG